MVAQLHVSALRAVDVAVVAVAVVVQARAAVVEPDADVNGSSYMS